MADLYATPNELVRFQPPPADAPEQDAIAWFAGLPLSGPLGIECQQLKPREGTFVVPRAPLVANPNGGVHGGIVAAIADQCLGAVAVLNSPHFAVTASLHGQFFRPALPALTVHTRLISAGKSLIYVECDIADQSRRRCATFQATMSVYGAERRSVDLTQADQ
jgi:uncharacterized protein (TIGR00369 family)